ncbi:MAG: hypothetical protein HOP21_11910 [Methylotenera sp.]|nr:hypothetical protein [Methylotenera sp.]
MDKPKLRDSKHRKSIEPFALNVIPDNVIQAIGEHLTYLISVGVSDISGEHWGDALAFAIGGSHLSSPLGIADVVLGEMAWSTKTVKNTSKNGVFNIELVNLISGRCSPDYSYGITNPHEDIQKTGAAVLSIWNERVGIAQDNYSPVRTSVLVRSQDLLSYVLFEEENHRFRTTDYEWKENKAGNLKGFLKGTDKQMFTWQPHGSQFTIHVDVPPSAKKFTLKKPPIIPKKETLNSIGFNLSWVTIFK